MFDNGRNAYALRALSVFKVSNHRSTILINVY